MGNGARTTGTRTSETPQSHRTNLLSSAIIPDKRDPIVMKLILSFCEHLGILFLVTGPHHLLEATVGSSEKR